MADKRESARLKDADQRKVLDEAARRRRARLALEILERDNFQEDPHANLVLSKKAPKFEETMPGKRKGRKVQKEPYKQKFRPNFAAVLEDEVMTWKPVKGKANYLSAVVPPSKYPDPHFCSVCGFPSSYVCPRCGMRFCSIKCKDVHQDTRCMKLTS